MAQACNPKEAKAGGSQGQEIETIPANMVKPHLYLNTKISWAWWRMPIVPATRESEAGELLEPEGGGCSEPRSHHSTPAWHLATERYSVSKQQQQQINLVKKERTLKGICVHHI